jgi:hypothetical protein
MVVSLGWLELDLIMGTWADENLQKLSVPQLEEVSALRLLARKQGCDRLIKSAAAFCMGC